jgi:hypothetical protein
MRKHDYRLDGRCVYCLENIRDWPQEQITDEHIIPRALNGSLIIRNGACKSCAELSNQSYENVALNNDLLIARRILELKKSRKRGKNQKPPRPLPPVARGDATMDAEAEFDLALADGNYPNHFSLVQFPPAGRVIGEKSGADLKSIRLQIFNLGNHQGRADNVTVRSPMVNGPFAKMLAKIAYCFAVAERGFEGFGGQDIRDLLAGRRDDVYDFVGTVATPELLTTRHLHSLYFRQRGDWLTVLVHLFASCGAEGKPSHPYEVVVGKIQNGRR